MTINASPSGAIDPPTFESERRCILWLISSDREGVTRGERVPVLRVFTRFFVNH